MTLESPQNKDLADQLEFPTLFVAERKPTPEEKINSLRTLYQDYVERISRLSHAVTESEAQALNRLLDKMDQIARNSFMAPAAPGTVDYYLADINTRDILSGFDGLIFETLTHLLLIRSGFRIHKSHQTVGEVRRYFVPGDVKSDIYTSQAEFDFLVSKNGTYFVIETKHIRQSAKYKERVYTRIKKQALRHHRAYVDMGIRRRFQFVLLTHSPLDDSFLESIEAEHDLPILDGALSLSLRE